MPNGLFELCAVDGEVLGQQSGAAADEHVYGEALDDKDEFEADLDLGATMSDLMRRCSGSGGFAWVGVSHFRR